MIGGILQVSAEFYNRLGAVKTALSGYKIKNVWEVPLYINMMPGPEVLFSKCIRCSAGKALKVLFCDMPLRLLHVL